MSFQAMTWAVEQDLKHTEKMVLIMLANYCNHQTGRCDPAHKRLAKECGMSVSTLKRSIDKLAIAGLLTVENREQEGVSLPNQYHLHLEVGSERTPPAHKKQRVGSLSADGSVHPDTGGGVQDELQTSKYNQEDKPGIKPLPGADNSAPADDGSCGDVVLSKQQQPSPDRIREVFWERFDPAYAERYQGVTLPRNAKVNSQVKKLIERLGKEAPAVAVFYVTQVTEPRVLVAQHSLDFLLLNAEGYRTQWATGRAMTQGRARQIDSTQTNASTADEAKAMLRAKRQREANQ